MALSTFFNSEGRHRGDAEGTAVVDVDDASIVDVAGQSEIAEGRWLEAQFVPALDLHRAENHFTLLIDLPGVDPSKVQLSVRDCLLKITGVRDISEPNYRLVRSEIISSDFERVIRLPRGADESAINAAFKNGVLEITIARKEEAASHRLSVESREEQERKVGS